MPANIPASPEKNESTLNFPPSTLSVVPLNLNLSEIEVKGFDILLPFRLPHPIPKDMSMSFVMNLLATRYSDPNKPVPARSLKPIANCGINLDSSLNKNFPSKLLSFRDWEPLNSLTEL